MSGGFSPLNDSPARPEDASCDKLELRPPDERGPLAGPVAGPMAGPKAGPGAPAACMAAGGSTMAKELGRSPAVRSTGGAGGPGGIASPPVPSEAIPRRGSVAGP